MTIKQEQAGRVSEGPTEDELLAIEDYGPDDSLFQAVREDDMVRLYFKDAAKAPLLSAKEEQDLGRAIQQGLTAKKSLVSGRLRAEKITDAQDAVQQGEEARERLILANTRWVITVAKRYLYRGTPLLDLIQGGNEGLLKAVVKFDPELGYRFSSYATWWIKNYITRTLQQDKTVHVPAHLNDILPSIRRAEELLLGTLLRKPSIREIAEQIGEKPERVVLALQSENIQPEDDVENNDEERSDSFDNMYRQESFDISSHDELLKMEQGLALLPPRLADIIILRNYYDATLDEVAAKYKFTRERARQMESKALRLLRYYMTFDVMPKSKSK
ncbi:sigma-70 family RNA polymerase sigma factor [Patescibacteria group bacterium]|nr:sigma-70 family RNA polymerase sigma factor [Patescibacteria group bacterium]MBU1472516.1 sigma-70 family RNA polymerase sigma factor [Patescibacteria group bacterium]MBU2460111.1 sigma-70 family RNA polymerase sigma factor [Patescibacteria group bacterium]MBU2544680.1 sigma-70 family RNA polymerase sigma factor [Patescibacteria group bacterium]